MTWRTEFPRFGTMPTIPDGFEDTSWRNDVCPSFVHPGKHLALWIAEAVPAEREFPEAPRFMLEWVKNVDLLDDRKILLQTDDWQTVLDRIAAATPTEGETP